MTAHRIKNPAISRKSYYHKLEDTEFMRIPLPPRPGPLVWALLCIHLMITAGCSSPNLDEVPEVFDTHIFDNGAKQFSYSLQVPGRSRDKGLQTVTAEQRREPRVGARPPDPREINRRARRALIKKLELKLSETGYCRDGYFLYGDHLFDTTNPYATRGECKDVASQEDRSRFPNKARASD